MIIRQSDRLSNHAMRVSTGDGESVACMYMIINGLNGGRVIDMKVRGRSRTGLGAVETSRIGN